MNVSQLLVSVSPLSIHTSCVCAAERQERVHDVVFAPGAAGDVTVTGNKCGYVKIDPRSRSHSADGP